jgi:hypothetical protein
LLLEPSAISKLGAPRVTPIEFYLNGQLPRVLSDMIFEVLVRIL